MKVSILVLGFTLHITAICQPPQSCCSLDLFHLCSSMCGIPEASQFIKDLSSVPSLENNLTLGNWERRKIKGEKSLYAVGMIDIFPGWGLGETALKQRQRQVKSLYMQSTKVAKTRQPGCSSHVMREYQLSQISIFLKLICHKSKHSYSSLSLSAVTLLHLIQKHTKMPN